MKIIPKKTYFCMYIVWKDTLTLKINEMKKLFVTLFALASFAFVSHAQTAAPVDSTKMPEITFDKVVNDFGKLPYSGNGATKFTFKNTGKTPLILSNVQSSCGCTVPEWPKEPVAPGESKVINVTYNTTRVGGFTKQITVYSNAKNGTVYLTIKGEVEPQAPQAAEPQPAK